MSSSLIWRKRFVLSRAMKQENGRMTPQARSKLTNIALIVLAGAMLVRVLLLLLTRG